MENYRIGSPFLLDADSWLSKNRERSGCPPRTRRYNDFFTGEGSIQEGATSGRMFKASISAFNSSSVSRRPLPA